MASSTMLVVARVRPSTRALTEDDTHVTPRGLRVVHASRSPAARFSRVDFPFQHALGPASTQDDVFAVVRGPIEAALDTGSAAVVFAYGQTGSGKTYTMLGGGTFRTRGLMQRALGLVFSRVDAAAGGFAPTVHLSMAEVLGEGVYDVLGHLPSGSASVASSGDPAGAPLTPARAETRRRAAVRTVCT